MGAFEYTALEPGGRERKGVLEGDTPRHIRQLLREQQLLPVTVTEVAQGDPWDVHLPTTLVKLRPGDKLPVWTKQPDGEWVES